MSKNKLGEFDFVDINDDKGNTNTAMADILGVLWNNRFWFFISIAIALIFAVIYVRSTPKIYSRTATILIKDDKQRGGGLNEASAFQDIFPIGSNSTTNEIGVLKSRQLMMQVVDQLNLATNYQTKDGLRSQDLYTSSPIEIEYLDEMAKQDLFTLTVRPLGHNKATLTYVGSKVDNEGHVVVTEVVNDIFLDSVIVFNHGTVKIKPTIFMSPQFVGQDIIISKVNSTNLAKSLAARLQVVNEDKQSTLVQLSITDTNPKRAEEIINTLVHVYGESTIHDKNAVRSSTLNFITKKVAVLEADLRLIDSDIEEYKKKNKLTDIASVSSMYLNTSSQINVEVLGLENQLSIANYMKEYLQDNTNQSELIPGNVGINHSGIESQIVKYNEAMAVRNKLLSNSTSNSPIVQDLQMSIVSMRSSILGSVDNLIASLNIQLQKYNSEEQKSNSNIAGVSSQHKFMVNIERQLKIKDELYLYLLKKQEESEIQLIATTSNCMVVDMAEDNGAPVAPNKAQIVLMSLLLGFMFPAVCLYIRSLLDTSVYTKKDIKMSIDIPFVGELPFEKSKATHQHLVVEDGNRSVVNEAFRLLRDNVEMMSLNTSDKGKVVLATSLNSGVGKTFITSNLALTMSLSNVKVVLIDMDLRKGSLAKRFGFDRKVSGLATYLSGKTNDIDSIINKYNDSSLDIIPSGTLPPNPAELLKNGRLKELITALKDRYDYIIIDSAPYGLVADTGVIAKYADISVIVVRSGMFDKRQLPTLAELYRSKSLNNLSVLLNAVDLSKIGYGYGSSYGNVNNYGYGYVYGQQVNKNFRYYIRKIFGI